MNHSAALLCALASALCACESQGSKPASPDSGSSSHPSSAVADVTAQDYPMARLPRARVTLVDAFGAKHLVDVEVAWTREQRTRGLMWRSELAEGTGMFFMFPQDAPLSFWMKNTLIPLDMIFIRSDFTIVGIVERAEPKSLASRTPHADSMYVLEVPGGWSERVGLKVGLKVQVEGIRALVPQP